MLTANYYCCWYRQDLPLGHTDCDEFFTCCRDLVFENLRPRRVASLPPASKADSEVPVVVPEGAGAATGDV